MKKALLFIFIILLSFQAKAQESAFDSGEWFKFRIHYGIFTASYATMQVQDGMVNGKEMYHIKGRGKSTGLLSWFFKVDDDYQTFFDKKTGQPSKFIRKIDEGGHTKDIQIDFDHDKKTALVNDIKHQVKTSHEIKTGTQDMLSAFYYLRNNVDTKNLIVGEEYKINLFFDKENFEFKLKFLGRELVETEFGLVPCLKLRPYVQSGRVFKEKESLTVWISDDKNRIPIRLQADLAVGSIKADLEAYKGLKHPFKIVVN
ncbi:MAG: DUF3108 domain-containing protein [Flavobacteriaceae bacterium]|nr:DUF3108 domain-containing protein [Flavobacteriaceae bacterium]